MSEDNNKEKLLNLYPIPITIECTNIILQQMKNCICKINNKKEKKEEEKSKEKKKRKNSENMNFVTIEKSEAINQVLYITYNQTNNYICLGTLSGFKIFSLISKPIELIYEFQFNPIEPVKIIEMLETTQLLILVGQKESTNLSDKKLSLFVYIFLFSKFISISSLSSFNVTIIILFSFIISSSIT